MPAGTGKKAPAPPQAMFDASSLITGKAPPDGQSDKKSDSSSLSGKTREGMRQRFAVVADSEPAAKIRSARKIVRAPGRAALSNSMGNGCGTVWISSIEHRPGRLKMTVPNGGAKPKCRQRIISLH
jgi:hypothetical protein